LDTGGVAVERGSVVYWAQAILGAGGAGAHFLLAGGGVEVAVSLEAAAQKWARNAVAGITANWQQGVNAVGPAGYCEGLAHLGINVGACQSGAGSRWAQGVSSVSAAAVAQRVQQAAAQNKWARRFVEAFNRT
jgi:hypothetical protein